MRSQREKLISHSRRGLHRGQRSLTAPKGRTYDRTVPVAPSFEKSTCLRGRSTYGGKPEVIGGDPLAQLMERQRKRSLSNLQGDRLQVGIGYVEERNSQFFVSFSVLNSTNEPVELMPPQVQLAGQTKSGLFKQSSRWTTVDQIPVMDFRLDQRKVNPGGRVDGLVVFDRPPMKQSNETLMLQIAEAAMVDKPVLVPITFSVSK